MLPGLIGGGSGFMMGVGPHDAATNFCNWLSIWRSCPQALDGWFDQWGWMFPVSLILFSLGLFFWPALMRLFGISLQPNSAGNVSGSGNIIANVSGSSNVVSQIGNLNLGHTRFEMTDSVMAEMLSKIDKSRPVGLVWVMTGRTPQMMKKLETYLELHGVTIGSKRSGPNVLQGLPLEGPITYLKGGNRLRTVFIAPDEQIIALDDSL
jgi:hypothetical protein